MTDPSPVPPDETNSAPGGENAGDRQPIRHVEVGDVETGFFSDAPPSETVSAPLSPSATASYGQAEWANALGVLPSRQSAVAPPARRNAPDETLDSPVVPRKTAPDETLDAPVAPAAQGPGATLDAPAVPAGPSATVTGGPMSGALEDLEPGAANDPGNSDFVLRQMIARGGQGEVWSAWQSNLAREVAVKKLSAGGNVLEFLIEAYTTAELDHPNIVPVYDLGRVGEGQAWQPLLAMKLARGMAWNEQIRRERYEIPPAQFSLEDHLSKHLRVLIDVCNAVAYAHAKGIIHRDLKPHQVIVGEFGEVFLMDWGLAVSPNQAPAPSAAPGVPKRHTLLTATNQTGSPAYMAPEQTSESAGALGFHTDVYLLGAILFELVAGVPPHSGQTAAEAYNAARDNIVLPLPPNCPEELADLIRRSLATDPAERPPSAEAFRDEVEAYLSGSNRRRDSRRLAEKIAERLSDERAAKAMDYAEMSEVRAEIVRALSLWADNPLAKALDRQLAILQARKAALQNDVRFAQSLAQQLDADDPERPRLTRLIALRRARLNREKKLRVWMQVLAGFLLVFLVTGVAMHSNQQERDNKKLADAKLDAEEAARLAEAARAEAENSRQRAEKLVNYMVFELSAKLDAIGRLDLLDDVAGQARDYYDGGASEEVSPENLAERARLLDSFAYVHMKRGRLEEALDTYREAVELAESMRNVEGVDELGRRAILAAGQANFGQVYTFQGLQGQAVEHLEKAREQFGQLVAEAPEDPRADSWRRQAILHGFEAARILQNEVALAKDALPIWDEVAGEAREFFSRHPEDVRVRALLSLAISNRAAAIGKLGEPEYALEEIKIQTEVMRENAAASDGTIYWEEALATALEDQGTFAWRLGKPEEALAAFSEGLAIQRRFAEADPTNGERWEKAAGTLVFLGRICSGSEERLAEAEKYFVEALEICGRLLEQSKKSGEVNPRWLARVLDTRLKLYAVLNQMERLDEAAVQIEKLVAEAEAGVETGGEVGGELSQMFLMRGRFYAACSYAVLGDADKAFEHLEEGVAIGVNNRELLETDEDLAVLREGHPERFAALLATLPEPPAEEEGPEAGTGEASSETEEPAAAETSGASPEAPGGPEPEAPEPLEGDEPEGDDDSLFAIEGTFEETPEPEATPSPEEETPPVPQEAPAPEAAPAPGETPSPEPIPTPEATPGLADE